MNQPRDIMRRQGHRTFRADAIRSVDLSLRVWQGFGADFRRKSEVRMPTVQGRKAESNRVFLFGSPTGGLADPPLRASNEGHPYQSFSSRGWNGCATGTKNFFHGSPPWLARRVSRRLCRRSEEAEAVRGRRKAETDRVREGISEGFRSLSPPQPLRRHGSLELFPPDVTSFAAPAASPPF